jgi:hypothetical protein
MNLNKHHTDTLMPDDYRYVIIESYRAIGEQSAHAVRARPLPGQGLPAVMCVECSSKMRERYPIGTKFKILAKIKDTDRDPHLYTSWQWKYEVVSDSQANAFIDAKNRETKK